MPLIIQGATSGSTTIQSTDAVTNTLTLPASTGTIVTDTGAQTIQFSAGTAAAPSVTTTGDTNTGVFFPAADTIAFAEGGAEAMRIDSSGRVLVGTTTTIAAKLSVKVSNGGSAIETNNTSGTANYNGALFYNNTNALCGYIAISGTTTSYATSSDYRLKENVTPMTGALKTVAQLKPVNYTWKQDGSNGQGFIAHELQEVVPDAVVGEKDAVDEEGNIKPQGIDTSFLVATLTAAIQEQQAIIETLTTRIEALEAK